MSACAGMSPDEPSAAAALARYPGAEQQIRALYESKAQERNYSCDQVDMGTITRVKAVTDTPTELRLNINYTFSSEALSPRQSEGCNNQFNTRIVTFAKKDGALQLTGMTGEMQ